MFKNLFSNKFNGLVYHNGNEAPKGVESVREPSKKDLQTEAKALGDAIDGYAKAIEGDINNLKSSDEQIKIDLNNPKSYEHLNRGLWSVVQSLAEAKAELKRGPLIRTTLDLVRIKVDAAAIFNRSLRLPGDPLAHSADVNIHRVAKAEARKEKAVQSKESVEAARWAKMALLVDEYNRLGDTRNDKTRKAAIQTELLAVASKAMTGKKYMEVNGLQITRAPGAGTEAFKLVMVDRARRLEQGGRPGARTVRYTEVAVYAGGSAKDFPTKRA